VQLEGMSLITSIAGLFVDVFVPIVLHKMSLSSLAVAV
jgi:hypothetical protein